MADVGDCLGHSERSARRNKIEKFIVSSPISPDHDMKVLIKKGPTSVERSLKELEENYASKPEWKVIEEGGVLSVPVEEFRMINLPKPDREGKIHFEEKKGKGAGNQIDKYPIAQTISNLNEKVLDKYNIEKDMAKANGTSKTAAEGAAQAMAKKLPEFIAVQKWLDNEAEIKLKKSLEQMMTRLDIPALILRSISVKAISALKDFGLKVSGDAEIDLVMACVSGDFLYVVVCEVKRADTYPWQKEFPLPNKQAVNKAENQLTKDMDVLMAILADTPPSQIIIHTLACFPEASSSVLATIFCSSCLETRIVSQDDLADLSLLQKKTQVPDKPDPATTSGKKNLLTLTARLLSHQSLLHIGYREVEDKEKLVTERHRYNLESVDGKLMQKEFIIASPQQQQVIANFTASSTKRHLVLEGPAGTGKTLVALQVAKNLMESAEATTEEGSSEPLLVVTGHFLKENEPIMDYLDASTGGGANKIFKGWDDLVQKFKVFGSWDTELLQLSEGLTKKYEGRQIVLLVDEIIYRELLIKHGEQIFPESVRMILILNPQGSSEGTPLILPESFLHVTLTTPYRSTIAITRLAHFIAEREGLTVPEVDFGSDVEGTKPIFFDVGQDERKVKGALEHCCKHLGDNVTILFDIEIPYFIENLVKDQEKEKGGSWDCYNARNFYGWEAEKVVAVTIGSHIMEVITRARTHLAVILVETRAINARPCPKALREHFLQAEKKGLVDIVHLNAN